MELGGEDNLKCELGRKAEAGSSAAWKRRRLRNDIFFWVVREEERL